MSKRLPPFSAAQLLQVLNLLPAVNSYLVGFSGGADSTALLFALTELGDQLDTPVSAVHINHGIHEDADLWQAHCERFCRQHSIELECINVNLETRNTRGLEAQARHLRYEAISALLEPGDCLLTAHHSDDQSETLLLNLMRGSGVDGLSAMPESRPLGAGLLLRPLLGFQNDTLRQYLLDKGIGWLEDPSNQFLNHDRNFVRHELIPLLENRWPGINKRLGLTRMAMSESRSLLEPLADEYLQHNLLHRFVLQVSKQLVQNPAQFKLIVRRWLGNAGVPTVPAHRLNTLYTQILRADSGQNITVRWDEWTLRVYKHQLWLLAVDAISPCPSHEWPAHQHQLDLGENLGRLIFKGPGQIQLPGQLKIGSRCNNRGIGLKQGQHHKSLKNLFQIAGIPDWFRDNVPLCILDGELVAIGDWSFSENFADWLSQNQVKFSWQPRNPLLQYLVARQHSTLATGDG